MLLGVLLGVFEGVLLADKVIQSVKPVCIAPEASVPKKYSVGPSPMLPDQPKNPPPVIVLQDSFLTISPTSG